MARTGRFVSFGVECRGSEIQADLKDAKVIKDLGPCGFDAQTVSGSEGSSTTGCFRLARSPGSSIFSRLSERDYQKNKSSKSRVKIDFSTIAVRSLRIHLLLCGWILFCWSRCNPEPASDREAKLAKILTRVALDWEWIGPIAKILRTWDPAGVTANPQ